MQGMKTYLGAERGAALVTVLLIVSVMSTLAVFAFDRLGYSIKRATAGKIYTQMENHALGAEQLALVAAEKLNKLSAGRQQRREVAYPIEGGTIAGAIEDQSNCFNVNSLVGTADGTTYSRNDVAIAEYTRLLQLIGFTETEAEQLTGTVADWLDADTQAGPFGAEDYDYARMTPPYRAANGPIADITELRLVLGYDPDVLARIIPYVCALSGSDETRLNVNSLRLSDAPLLAAMVGDKLSLAAAERLISARPRGGFDSQTDFWRQPVFTQMAISQSVRSRALLKPYRYQSNIAVRFQDAQLFVTSIIEMGDDGHARLTSRRFGAWN